MIGRDQSQGKIEIASDAVERRKEDIISPVLWCCGAARKWRRGG